MSVPRSTPNHTLLKCMCPCKTSNWIRLPYISPGIISTVHGIGSNVTLSHGLLISNRPSYVGSKVVQNYPHVNLKQGPLTLSTNANARILKIHGLMTFVCKHALTLYSENQKSSNAQPLKSWLYWTPHVCMFYRSTVLKYSDEALRLAQRLLGCISESLGEETTYVQEALGEPSQNILMNYYCPCPQPELALGLMVSPS